MKKHVGCRLSVLLEAPHHAIIFTDHPLQLNAMRNFPWALLRLMQGLVGLAEFLPHDPEKKVCVLAPGQMEHFEALIDVNEDEAAEENANEWAAVLRVANKCM